MRLLITLASIGARIVYLQANSGYQPPSMPPTGAQDKPSQAAIITLICGIGAWTFFPFIAAIIGAFVGWSELNKIKSGQSPEAGKTVTQIGFYLSVANLVLSLVGGCITGLVFALMFGGIFAAEGLQ